MYGPTGCRRRNRYSGRARKVQHNALSTAVASRRICPAISVRILSGTVLLACSLSRPADWRHLIRSVPGTVPGFRGEAGDARRMPTSPSHRFAMGPLPLRPPATVFTEFPLS